MEPDISYPCDFALVQSTQANDYRFVLFLYGAEAKIRLIDRTGRMVKEVPVAENSTETVMGVGNIQPGIFKIIWTDGKDSFVKTVLISR